MSPAALLTATPMRVRHIKRTANQGTIVIGSYLLPQDQAGINGQKGWQSGTYERRLYEEGAFTLTLPVSVGDDQVEHLDRFLCLSNRSAYRPGDEWIEIYREDQPGKPLFVGTPIRPSVKGKTIELNGSDGLELLKKVREKSACFWNHAPRDVWEHYTGVWSMRAASNFTDDNFAGGAGTTLDNLWAYTGGSNPTNKPGNIRLTASGPGASASIASNFWTLPVGGNGSVWRVEAVISRVQIGVSGGGTVRLGVGNFAGGVELVLAAQLPDPQKPVYARSVGAGAGAETVYVDGNPDLVKGAAEIGLAIESRERWVYFYVNGVLLGVLPQPNGASMPSNQQIFLTVGAGSGGTHSVDVSSLLVRSRSDFLLRGADKGDYRLPGAPTQGGLVGSYFSDADRPTSDTTSSNYRRVLGPDRKPYTRQQDETIDNLSGGTNTWIPPGPPGNDDYSVRWTGSIYLDLDNYDYAFYLSILGRARLWIGKTRMGEQIIDQWPQSPAFGTFYTTWLKAGSVYSSAPAGATGPLAGMKSGWYPIVLEFNQGSSSPSAGGITFAVERSDGVNTFVTANSDAKVKFSPLGIYTNQPRYESHYEVLKALSDQFGYQFTCAPRSLESGEFPGQVIPRLREGRDTDYVLDEDEDSAPASDLDATGVADILIADAQGLADQDEGAQLKAEMVNYSQVMSHFLLHEEYDTPSDITNPELLIQRLTSLLALRQSPWETVQAQPKGARELRDTFPLTGSLALFDWTPGDGIRLNFPSIGVVDGSARQILGVARPFRPGGVGAPTATFRQRPRSFSQVLRDLRREQVKTSRNYQNQLVVLNGNNGGNAGHHDRFSRVGLPERMQYIVKAYFVVHAKKSMNGSAADTSAWAIEVNDQHQGYAVTFKRPGRYDITRFVGRYGGSDQRITARAIDMGSSTGRVTYSLELLVRV